MEEEASSSSFFASKRSFFLPDKQASIQKLVCAKETSSRHATRFLLALMKKNSLGKCEVRRESSSSWPDFAHARGRK